MTPVPKRWGKNPEPVSHGCTGNQACTNFCMSLLITPFYVDNSGIYPKSSGNQDATQQLWASRTDEPTGIGKILGSAIE